MSTASIALTNSQIQRSPAATATIYLKEAKYEFLKNLRLRMYTASVLSFPIMFYVLFGLVLNSKQAIGSTSIPTYLIATYGTFGVMGASLFGTAAGPGSPPGLGWAPGEARQPHAAVRLLRSQGDHEHDFQHHHRAGAFRVGNHAWRSAHAAP